MKRYSVLLIITALLSLYGCNKDDGPPPSPVAAQLVFPEQNSECTTGVSVDATQSRVTFSWNASVNTDLYELTVTHLISGFTQDFTTTATSFDVNILKGNPYSWSVTSSSDTSTQTAQSETWNFYNAGDGVQSYAPFPAGVISPQIGATVVPDGDSVTLLWDGADVDNDISGYDVYFDIVDPPAAIVGNSVSAAIFQVNGITPSTVYYWRIVTSDLEGNTSTSEVFEFRTVD